MTLKEIRYRVKIRGKIMNSTLDIAVDTFSASVEQDTEV